MKILNPEFSTETFFELLKTRKNRVLMLDYDGTLAPFQVERDAAVPYPGIREQLEEMIRAGHTRIVVVSGRSIEDLVPLLGIQSLPELWGSHGWERLHVDGQYEIADIPGEAVICLEEAQAWIVRENLEDRCELKPASVAVHWRGVSLDEQNRIRDMVMHHWLSLAVPAKCLVREFDGGMELRVPGRNKGFAVRQILAETGPDYVAAFLGDDMTDEDAFKAMKGKGCSILVRREYHETCADMWIVPPQELRRFLSDWQDAGRYLV